MPFLFHRVRSPSCRLKLRRPWVNCFRTPRWPYGVALITMVRPPPPCSSTLLFVVVRDVTVEQPLARFAGRPDHVVALAGADVDHILRELRRRRHRIAVGRRDPERPAVDVHRVAKLLWLPFLELDHILEVVRGLRARFPGVDDQRAVEAQRLLAIGLLV